MSTLSEQGDSAINFAADPVDAIASRRIAVVGTGALGSEFCRLLIERGANDVLLVDPDLVEAGNIAISALFSQAQALWGGAVGMPKVEVVRRLALEHGLAWDALAAEIADVGWFDLRRSDVLVCCADSVLARAETAAVARSLRLPMLDGGVASNGHPQGRAAYFPAGTDYACYLCGLADSRRAEILAYALSPSLGCLPDAEFPPMTGATEAVRQVAQTLLQLLDRMPGGQPAFALRLDARTGGNEYIRLPRGAGCPWHELPEPARLLALDATAPLAAALHMHQDTPEEMALDLFWPVCLRARCRLCGALSEPCRRTAWVRRRGQCSQCVAGAEPGTLEPLESVASLRLGDTAATRTPRQLGLPERHLYYRRPVAKSG